MAEQTRNITNRLRESIILVVDEYIAERQNAGELDFNRRKLIARAIRNYILDYDERIADAKRRLVRNKGGTRT